MLPFEGFLVGSEEWGGIAMRRTLGQGRAQSITIKRRMRSGRVSRALLFAVALAASGPALSLLPARGAEALAACSGPCSGESGRTGLAQPPSWAAARIIHFEPRSLAASAYPDSGAPVIGAGLPQAYLRDPESGAGVGPLLYHEGGSGVQHKPRVYLIMWGENFNTLTSGRETKTMLLNLLQGLTGPATAYQGIMTQYFDGEARVSRETSVATYSDESVKAPGSLNETKVEEEVGRAIKKNAWPIEKDAQFILVTAPGSTYARGFGAEFCAYHGLTAGSQAVYAFIPYQGDPPFGTNGCLNTDQQRNPVHKTSKSVSHEYAEAATDPRLNSWLSSSGAEIADLCSNEIDLELFPGVWVQNQYDNYLNACAHSDATPADVYAITESASSVTSSAATLRGIVNPENRLTAYHFEYGTSASYGTSSASASAGSGIANVSASLSVGALTRSATYHFRLVATNATGTVYGKDATFVTRRR
jgi:hypothetical protein